MALIMFFFKSPISVFTEKQFFAVWRTEKCALYSMLIRTHIDLWAYFGHFI